MKTQTLYYLTASRLLLTVCLGAFFLLRTTTPTADVKASDAARLVSISTQDISPGETVSFRHNGAHLIIWRRTGAEISSALSQYDKSISDAELAAIPAAVADGTLARTLGPQQFGYLEWFVVSATNPGGRGCIVMPKAGEYGGFYDPCENAHFDLWGRHRKGPGDEDLQIIPLRVSVDNHSITVDLKDAY